MAYPWLALLCLALIRAAALADESTPLDPDAQAALKRLSGLPPEEQRGVILEVERSRDLGELDQTQFPLVSALVECESWTEENRRYIALVLATLGNEARPSIEKLTYSRSTAVREAAREAQALHQLLHKTDAAKADERRQAVSDLAQFGVTHSHMSEFLLGRLEHVYTRRYEPSFEVRAAALRGMVRLGEPAAPRLVESLAQPDPFYLRYSSHALKQLGQDGRDAVLAGLEHRNALVRQRAIFVLQEMGLDREAAEAIRPLERDGDELVRKAAQRALAAFRRTSAGSP